jgi:hypothetical protein
MLALLWHSQILSDIAVGILQSGPCMECRIKPLHLPDSRKDLHTFLDCGCSCRFPFLLVDRVVELETQKYAIGYKNVTANDNFFTGHFPERKIMPGATRL